MLSNAEKRFIQRALRANAPGTFITHHVWICRHLKVDPDMIELDALDVELSAFVLEAEN